MRRFIAKWEGKVRLPLLLCLLMANGLSQDALAQWQPDGDRVCPTDGYQFRCQLMSDGVGGAILVWEDGRVPEHDIYCARFTGSGKLSAGWPTTGAALSTAPGFQGAPVMVSDGAGGALAAWIDTRDLSATGKYDTYAQRITASGQIATGWPVDGLALCKGSGGFPRFAADGAGGAFAVWSDNRNTDYNHDVYSQHLTGAGSLSPGWPSNGYGVNTSARDDVYPTAIVPDGTGGAFVAWNSFIGADVFAQRITASGAIVSGWPSDGVPVSAVPGDQLEPRLAPDGAGGLFLTWYDARSDNGDVYAQRVTAFGTIAPGWVTNGVPMCTAASDQFVTGIVGVPSGAIIVWHDHRAGPNYKIYAQFITDAGTIAPGWPVDGLAVCPSLGDQRTAVLVPDETGGAIVAWRDTRSDSGQIYAQRLTASGAIAEGWPTDGVAVGSAKHDWSNPAIATDGAGGAMICWSDSRTGYGEIYLARVTSTGLTGSAIPVAPPSDRTQILGIQPNPMRDHASVVFRLPSPTEVRAEAFDIAGRQVATLAANQLFGAGDQALGWNGLSQAGSKLHAGVYTIRVATKYGSSSARVVLLP